MQKILLYLSIMSMASMVGMEVGEPDPTASGWCGCRGLLQRFGDYETIPRYTSSVAESYAAILYPEEDNPLDSLRAGQTYSSSRDDVVKRLLLGQARETVPIGLAIFGTIPVAVGAVSLIGGIDDTILPVLGLFLPTAILGFLGLQAGGALEALRLLRSYKDEMKQD